MQYKDPTPFCGNVPTKEMSFLFEKCRSYIFVHTSPSFCTESGETNEWVWLAKGELHGTLFERGLPDPSQTWLFHFSSHCLLHLSHVCACSLPALLPCCVHTLRCSLYSSYLSRASGTEPLGNGWPNSWSPSSASYTGLERVVLNPSLLPSPQQYSFQSQEREERVILFPSSFHCLLDQCGRQPHTPKNKLQIEKDRI